MKSVINVKYLVSTISGQIKIMLSSGKPLSFGAEQRGEVGFNFRKYQMSFRIQREEAVVGVL